MRPPVLAVTVAVTAFGLGHLWSRSPIAPIAYSLPPLPTLPRPGPKSRTHSLAKAERWFQGRVSGAEHIDFYCAPNAVRCAAYTGLSDGSIVRFDPEAGPDGPIEFLNRTSVLHHGEAPAFLADCGDPEFAHLCGRPLGLKVTHDGTTLVIADATYGVLALDLATNALTLLANEYVDSEGVARRINMANSIAVCRDGSVYFTQTSTTFSLKNLMLDFMQARDFPQRLRTLERDLTRCMRRRRVRTAWCWRCNTTPGHRARRLWCQDSCFPTAWPCTPLNPSSWSLPSRFCFCVERETHAHARTRAHTHINPHTQTHEHTCTHGYRWRRVRAPN